MAPGRSATRPTSSWGLPTTPRALARTLGLLLLPAVLLAATPATAKKSSASDPKQIEYKGPMAKPAVNRFTTQANTPFAQTGGFDVDVTNRQHVQAFFNSVYTASENTPLTYTGSVAGCSSGTTPELFKDAVRLRINWFRELAGVTDNITFRPSFNASAQDAALIMAANGLLTHTPASSLNCYTSTGDDGAGSSNLALGSLGWESITGYMEDAGANNAAVGHRRWLLHPPTLEMGTGDVPATANSSATNAIWVFDDNIFADGADRDGFVAWPPPAYVPHSVVPARWSFSLKDANFTNATVSMTRDGSAISTTLEPVSTGAGLNTLVWIPLGLDAAGGEPWPQPDKDETLSVNLSNVVIDGTPQSFSYDVQVFAFNAGECLSVSNRYVVNIKTDTCRSLWKVGTTLELVEKSELGNLASVLAKRNAAIGEAGFALAVSASLAVNVTPALAIVERNLHTCDLSN